MIIYTDGACSANGSANAVGGFGVVVLDDNENLITCYKEHADKTTNNRMELSAILWAMFQYGNEQPVPIVYSDSAYAVNTLTVWMWGWERKGWLKSDNTEPENLDLIQAFHKLWNMGYRIDLRKCKGHSGDHWNEMADKLAVAAKENLQEVTMKVMEYNKPNRNNRIIRKENF